MAIPRPSSARCSKARRSWCSAGSPCIAVTWRGFRFGFSPRWGAGSATSSISCWAAATAPGSSRAGRLSRPRSRACSKLILKSPALAVIAVRFLYGVRIAGPIVIGASTLAVAALPVLNAIGALLWSACWLALGFFLGTVAQRMLGDLAQIERELFIGVIVAAGIAIALVRALRARAATADVSTRLSKAVHRPAFAHRFGGSRNTVDCATRRRGARSIRRFRILALKRHAAAWHALCNASWRHQRDAAGLTNPARARRAFGDLNTSLRGEHSMQRRSFLKRVAAVGRAGARPAYRSARMRSPPTRSRSACCTRCPARWRSARRC